MTFSHDTELSLLVVVDLVNTAAETGGTETLPDADALRSWVDKHHVSSVAASDYSDVASIHKVRERFRQCFGLSDAELLAERVNTLAGRSIRTAAADRSRRLRLAHPLLRAWRDPRRPPGASTARWRWRTSSSAEEVERLRVCEAPDCEAVLLDLSRNRSKRYCDARTCGNRLNVAAYRQRKRSELPLDEA